MEKYELKENNTYYYKHHLYVVIIIGRQKMDNGAWEKSVHKEYCLGNPSCYPETWSIYF